jgi:hypothetical protein
MRAQPAKSIAQSGPHNTRPLMWMNMRTADDLFGTPSGSPRIRSTDRASIQWAEKIMQKIDASSRESDGGGLASNATRQN